jgi:hypothetical protein
MEKLTQKLLTYLSDKPNYEKFSILHNEMGYDFNFIKELYPNDLKTFEDLNFKQHPNNWMEGAVQAWLDFDNGHFVSVVGGGNGLYGDGVKTFEVGFTLPDGNIDVEGWLPPEQVTRLMFQIQIKEPYV